MDLTQNTVLQSSDTPLRSITPAVVDILHAVHPSAQCQMGFLLRRCPILIDKEDYQMCGYM